MAKSGFLQKISRLFQGSEEVPPEETASTANDSTATVVSPAPTEAVSSKPATQPQAPATTPETGRIPVQPPRPQRSEPPAEPTPRLTIEQIAYNGGPEVKIVVRGGAKTYAVCPKCEAMWNVKDRLTVIMQKHIDKSLTCAACEQVVSLPQSLNLRKL